MARGYERPKLGEEEREAKLGEREREREREREIEVSVIKRDKGFGKIEEEWDIAKVNENKR